MDEMRVKREDDLRFIDAVPKRADSLEVFYIRNLHILDWRIALMSLLLQLVKSFFFVLATKTFLNDSNSDKNLSSLSS